MKILFDIGHPAHVHLFKTVYERLKTAGHQVFITVKNIPSVLVLLHEYDLEFINLGDKPRNVLKKVFHQFKFNRRLHGIIRKNKIDISIGVSMTIAHASFMTKTKSIVLDDDDYFATPMFAIASHLMANQVLVPDCIKTFSLNKVIPYAGYHELAYLHPNIFQPDKSVLDQLGLIEDEIYFVLRFNAFEAHHDYGEKGFSLKNKRSLIEKLKQHGKVFITGENTQDIEFSQYLLPTSESQIHSVLYYATLFVSDSQTMTSEASILGTPALKCNSFAGRLSVANELEEKYQLCFAYKTEAFNKMLVKIDELLSTPDLKNTWSSRREKMLHDKINVSAFLVWLIENYPKSIEEAKSRKYGF